MQNFATTLLTSRRTSIVASFLVGCLATGLVSALLVIPTVRDSWRGQGQNEGRVSALWEVTEKIKTNFVANRASSCLERGELTSVKTRQIVMVECAGTMSLRLVE